MVLREEMVLQQSKEKVKVPEKGKKKEAKEAKKEETKEKPKPKYEWVEVKKLKKRNVRTPVPVTALLKPGTTKELLAEQTDIETKIISDSLAVKENDDRRNELESYI